MWLECCFLSKHLISEMAVDSLHLCRVTAARFFFYDCLTFECIRALEKAVPVIPNIRVVWIIYCS